MVHRFLLAMMYASSKQGKNPKEFEFLLDISVWYFYTYKTLIHPLFRFHQET